MTPYADGRHIPKSIPHPKPCTYTPPMTFNLAPHIYVLSEAQNLHDRVLARDGLMFRPEFGTKAIAARLRRGVRALAAFLRRILILMALEMEPTLVNIHHPENLARAKAKKYREPKFSFQIYPDIFHPTLPDFDAITAKTAATKEAKPVRPTFDRILPVEVPLGQWLNQLNHLYIIAKDPLAKARRLAYSLARGRPGILLPPPDNPNILRRWGLAPSALFDAMGCQILDKSRTRPPPLPPRWRVCHPTITLM